jgi:hypothetical protein
VIGRLDKCEIPVDDTLVSRVHAVIRIDEHGIRIEDLHSTNGVYVNDRRVARSAKLEHGDRILVGTTELSLFKPARHSKRKSSPARAPAQPQAPISLGRLKRHETEATGKASALGLVGALAQRLVAGGNLKEAQRVLSTHLGRVLSGAQSGLVVTSEISELAAQYALDLSLWTRKAQWLNYVVELHLATQRVMSDKTRSAFASIQAQVPEPCDVLLFAYYVESMKERAEPLSDAERLRLARLEELRRGPR